MLIRAFQSAENYSAHDQRARQCERPAGLRSGAWAPGSQRCGWSSPLLLTGLVTSPKLQSLSFTFLSLFKTFVFDLQQFYYMIHGRFLSCLGLRFSERGDSCLSSVWRFSAIISLNIDYTFHLKLILGTDWTFPFYFHVSYTLFIFSLPLSFLSSSFDFSDFLFPCVCVTFALRL